MGGMVEWRTFVIKKNKYLVNGFILLCAFVVIFQIGRRSPFYPRKPVDIQLSDKYVTYSNSFTGLDGEVKKILLWTRWFRGWGWLSEATRFLYTCPNNCEVTNDRRELNNSRAILFHADDFWEYRQSVFATLYNPVIPLPRHRSPNQVWVFWSVEPVIHFFGNVPPNLFNWTAYIRRDSTIFMPYEWYTKKSENISNENVLKTSQIENHFAKKTKLAVTVASNCRVPSRRYRILRELSKHIHVDEFGSCSGKIICPKSKGTAVCSRYIADYKFYLAFENSYCRDYLSEKVWRAFDRNQIPVIAASDSTVELLPRDSYLNVFDFPTLEHLANRMLEVGNNETLFNSFFLWRKHYVKDTGHAWCKLCRALYENRTHQYYHDLEGWLRKDSCSKPSAWRLIFQFIDRLLFDLHIW